jgi:hypothetical protein
MALVAVAVCALLHMAAIAPGRRESELDHGPVFRPPQRGDENGQQVICSMHARFTVSAMDFNGAAHERIIHSVHAAHERIIHSVHAVMSASFIQCMHAVSASFIQCMQHMSASFIQCMQHMSASFIQCMQS